MTLISKRRVFGGLAALTILGASAGMAMSTTAASERTDDTLRVATFEPQVAFEGYHRAAALTQRMQGLQQEMQEAQQQGDQQRMMELQQRMQEMQSEVVEAFYEDLEKAMPEVAQEANVQIVAVDIMYTDPEIGEAEDVTTNVVEQINGNEGGIPDAPEPAPSPW